MVSRAASRMLEQHRCRRAPPRPPNAAHGSGRASAASCSRAAARSAGLEKRRSPERQRLVGAEHQPAGHAAPPPPAPSRAPAAPRPSPGSARPRCASIARSSISAGCDLDRNAGGLAAARAALALFDASTSGCVGEPERHALYATGCRRRSASSAHAPPRRFPRSSGASRRCSASCAWRRACARTRPPRPPPCGRYIDRRRDAALQPEQPVLADLHDPLRAGVEPDHQRLRQRFDAAAAPATPGTSGTLPVFTPRLAR